TAVGYREGLTVDVTVEDSQVVDIEIVDHNEIGRRYYQKAMDLIPAAILKAESTDVDSVSGATCTSYGIMSAVEDALHNF
ncbi:MAG: FMN-binding protein, partial [Spirochaetales bacterium]|nr:FMN-binding protein [Spirochaetales bacterium]